MTQADYLAALKKIGLSRASKATAAALGPTVRQCQRYASGTSAVPPTLAKLLRLAVQKRLTPEQLAAL